MNEDKYIWSLILTFLDYKSICMAEGVCHFWYDTIVEHKLWRVCYLDTFHRVLVRVPPTTSNPPSSTHQTEGGKEREQKRRKNDEGEKKEKRERRHKHLDHVKNMSYKKLYQKRYLQTLRYFPAHDSSAVSTESDGMFENKGKISALWGAYQHTYGVNMNRVIGLSDWLAVLGFEANYFEVWITHGSMGLSNEKARRQAHVGWDPRTIGYHSDDGSIHGHGRVKTPGAKVFGENDIVGCGFFTHDGEKKIFFTCNGEVVYEHVFKRRLLYEDLFPKVCLQSTGARACFNMGARPFMFDVVDYLQQKTEPTRV